MKTKRRVRSNRKTRRIRTLSSQSRTTVDIVDMLMKLKHSIKLYHWTSDEYRVHITTDGYLKQLDPLIDQYVEVMLGLEKKHERKNKEIERNLKQKLCEMKIKPLDSIGELNELLNSSINMLKQHEHIMNVPELLAIRDEIVAETQKFKYLLGFKE
jgi:hypothetical protein